MLDEGKQLEKEMKLLSGWKSRRGNPSQKFYLLNFGKFFPAGEETFFYRLKIQWEGKKRKERISSIYHQSGGVSQMGILTSYFKGGGGKNITDSAIKKSDKTGGSLRPF